MHSHNKKCASKASNTSVLGKAVGSKERVRSHCAGGGELVQNELASGFKFDPSYDPSTIRELAAQQVPREALLKLAYVLKDAHEQMKREGYVIINGKLTKAPVDSAKAARSGMMTPLSDNHVHRK